MKFVFQQKKDGFTLSLACSRASFASSRCYTILMLQQDVELFQNPIELYPFDCTELESNWMKD